MKQYSLSKNEVRSHTEARASDRYNQRLDTRRAKSTVKYLISQEINRSRLLGTGYGEKQLVNSCSNGISCTDLEHKLNRN